MYEYPSDVREQLTIKLENMLSFNLRTIST